MTQLNLPYSPNTELLFDSIAHEPWSVYLDSCFQYSEQGRYDIITSRPQTTLTTYASTTYVHTVNQSPYSTQAHPFEVLASVLASCDYEPCDNLPYDGGALGYFSYDLAPILHPKLTFTTKPDIDMPLMAIGIYPWAVIIDHQTQHTTLFIQPCLDQANTLALQQHWLQTSQAVSQANHTRTTHIATPNTATALRPLTGPFVSNTSRVDYCKKFEQVHHHLTAGDCYQVNLAQRFVANTCTAGWPIYQRMRQHNPSPYAAYLHFPFGEVLSLSPEQFLHIAQGQVSTQPIKGTRPRDSHPHIDEALRASLTSSEKDQAENLMIVDLLRNDLSQHCLPGSVKVPKLFAVESFANVHHLVSTITGTLSAQSSPLQLFQSAFPGGSITGAPKLRAMQIIASLENARRSLYCGSIGYITPSGKLHTNIAIRTFILWQGKLYCYAGGGIVIDSTPEEEYQETLDKVSNMLTVLSQPL